MGQSDARPAGYRLFWTNTQGRISTAPDVILASDDAEAVREAEKVAVGRAVEVWQRSRKIATLNGSERH